MARTPVAYVEVFDRLYAGEEEISANWEMLIRASPLMEWSDWSGPERSSGCYPFAFLFGVSAVGCNDLRGVTPIAADRGLPRDLSLSLRFDILEKPTDNAEGDWTWSRFFETELPEDAPIQEGTYGHTWVSWHEIKQIDRRRVNAPKWNTLFSIVETLAGTYGENGVRLVFWLNR